MIKFFKISRDFCLKLVSLDKSCMKPEPQSVPASAPLAWEFLIEEQSNIAGCFLKALNVSLVLLVLLIIFLAYKDWKQDCVAARRWTDRHAHNVNWNQTNREETPMAWEEVAEVCTSQHIHWVNCEPQPIRHLPSLRDQSELTLVIKICKVKIGRRTKIF